MTRVQLSPHLIDKQLILDTTSLQLLSKQLLKQLVMLTLEDIELQTLLLTIMSILIY